ncbi:DNA repair and recombination protein RadA, partial [Candidatus Pacearchaeota archaeon]|nr:DNA repair and recombination protein RadA [Candidatus Pacearchaeota archaeon]
MSKKDIEKDSEEDSKKIKDAVSGEEEDSKKTKSKEVKKEPELTDLPGIGPAVAAKLEGAGILDLMSLAVSSPAVIADSAGVSPAVARKAIQAARTMLDLGFQDGMQYAKKREDVSYITTGSQNLNNLLGGKG